jgi:hypothetical protein
LKSPPIQACETSKEPLQLFSGAPFEVHGTFAILDGSPGLVSPLEALRLLEAQESARGPTTQRIEEPNDERASTNETDPAKSHQAPKNDITRHRTSGSRRSGKDPSRKSRGRSA